MTVAVSHGSQVIGADLNPEIYFTIESPLKEHLNNKITTLVMRFLFGPEGFGKESWFHWFGVDVGEEPEMTKECILFCYQNKTQLLNFPILRPQYINKKPFTLELFGTIVQHPKNNGYAASKPFDNAALRQHQKTPALAPCWLVPIEGPGVDAESYSQKMSKAGFEVNPPAIDLAAVTSTQYVTTGIVKIDKEHKWITACCQEQEENVERSSDSVPEIETHYDQEDKFCIVSLVPNSTNQKKPKPLVLSTVASAGIAFRGTGFDDGILALHRF